MHALQFQYFSLFYLMTLARLCLCVKLIERLRVRQIQCLSYLIYCWSGSYNSRYFLDVDECLEGTSVCEDVCINREGSYSCECSGLGFKLSWDLASCSGKTVFIIFRHSFYMLARQSSGLQTKRLPFLKISNRY